MAQALKVRHRNEMKSDTIEAVYKNIFRIQLYNQYVLKVQTLSCNLRLLTSKSRWPPLARVCVVASGR